MNFPAAEVEVEAELDKYYQPQKMKVQIDNSGEIQEVRIGEIEKEKHEEEVVKKLEQVQTGISQVLQISADRIDLIYLSGDDVIEDF